MEASNIPPAHLRFVSYNVEALGQESRTSTDIGSADKNKVENIAQSILELNGDVVALQEVPSREALDSFVSQHLAEGQYKYTHFFKTNDPGNHHLAVLSRFPITETESNVDRSFPVPEHSESMRFSRDVAETQIDLNGYPLRLYDVHLKADPYYKGKNANNPVKIREAEMKRRAEMQEIRRIILEDMKQYPSMLYVVAGDMNEGPDEGNIALLEKEGPGSLVDPLENSRGPESISHPATHERKDFLMLSPDLAAAVIPSSPKIHHSAHSENASDHLPVTLTVDFEALQKEQDR